MNQIYISYAWKDNKSEEGQKREELVDRICDALLAERYNLIRDRNDLSLGKSIQNFMRAIGRGNYVIVVVSDKYLRSEYCMFEAVEIMKNAGIIKDREDIRDQKQENQPHIFPVVLKDANIYNLEGRNEYIQYWNNEKIRIENLICAELAPEQSSALQAVAEKIVEISNLVDDFIEFIRDRISLVTDTINTDSSQDIAQFVSQITHAIKADAAKTRSTKSVLVVGTGNFHLPNEVLWCAQWLGQKIAEFDYKLITGGWEGVDYVVADSFATQIAHKRIPLSEKLTHIVPRGKEPKFQGGTVEYTEPGVREWLDCLRRSDLVILLGGVGGTYETYHYAKQERVPVLPIVCTNGDAKRVFDEMLQNWDAELMGRISPDKFKSLNQYINDEATARDVVNDVMDITNEIIFSKTMLKA
ncbi:toll/interleukin-1 receptor domain-containing protein [Oscillatoria sp. FACHB-1407]|uniref:toll/interleukin-1 receptor domain-containing protein n=1 Tax=Oscillatoria sp. FACHB-1407 TaxID=2692847 RepID=UPI0016879B93|nr:toll/interleukin-1 receptor domain-containing protein [Oscillatoria sp. FACHB-1407]MBD2461277.1 toll/interleukin-1 receptor domain-containing protein [Oscillatoria sp. FACHB-1407]